MADQSVDESQEIIIRAGSTSANELEVNSDGSINVVSIISPALTVYTSFVTLNPPTTGNQATPLVSAVSGKKIRVLSYDVSLGVSSANTYLRDGTGGSQLSVLWLRATGGSVPTFYSKSSAENFYLFQTSVNTPLIINCSTNTGTVSIQIVYVLV